MKETYTVEGIGKITLTDKEYLGSGGEGSLYVREDIAYKIFHEAKNTIPAGKIKELELIKAANVLRPKRMIYNKDGKPVGYAMDFKKNTTPLCKLFTKAFKQKNSISNEDITALIEYMQKTVNDYIHPAQCLIVDFNELNVLTSKKFDIPYFIDVDSYQTPSFRATAIMESIRDRMVKGNKWTTDSDWYSFAIIAFQLWIGIHPYKGSHPDYKPNEWQKRMEDGVSVLDPKASLPSVCNDFSVIPPSHMAWFKEIFLKNQRGKPPTMGELAAIISVPQTFNVIAASNTFDISRIEDFPESILDVFNFMGINYAICSKKIYKGKSSLPVEISGFDKIKMCESSSVAPVVCKLKDEIMYAEDDKGNPIGNISAIDMMYRNGCIYTVHSGKLMENSFTQFGEKVIHSTRLSCNILDMATKVFDGIVVQNLLGSMYLTIPYEKGSCSNIRTKELDGFRVLDARSERNICGVMAEKSGIYYCFVFCFNPDYKSYSCRISKDVNYCDINLTVLPNGIAAMANNSSVEIFKGGSVKVIDNPPFSSTNKLFNYSGSVYYIDSSKIYSARMKK